MTPDDSPADVAPAVESTTSSGEAMLSPLLRRDVRAVGARADAHALAGAVIGELLALDDDLAPLVRYPGQPGSAAVRARASVDLHGPHIGSSVVLMFENADPARPIVIGVLCGSAGWPADSEVPAQVELDADGKRMIVSAREQLVLRCGKASITLSKGGEILIDGSYVSSRSSGANRLRGGSVQIN